MNEAICTTKSSKTTDDSSIAWIYKITRKAAQQVGKAQQNTWKLAEYYQPKKVSQP